MAGRVRRGLKGAELSEKWPGLPRGVKFDPSDEELLWHLLAEIGEGETQPHPFIGEFIISLDDPGVNYPLPHSLPGVKQDGNVSYFFHKSNGGKPKKIPSDDLGTACWQKVGKSKPVYVDGIHKGSKKVLVLYTSMPDWEQREKTNWIMHQYHAGVGEDVQGGLVISKIFYKLKLGQGEQSSHERCMNTVEIVGPKAETEISLKIGEAELHAGSSNSTSMGVPNRVFIDSPDMVMDGYSPKAEPSGEIYGSMANEGEASQPMLNPSDIMLDTQAHIRRHVTSVKVEPFNDIEGNIHNEIADKISPVAMDRCKLVVECENDEIDHVTLQERYKLMLSSMNEALGCHYNFEFSEDITNCTTALDSDYGINDKDSEVIPRKQKRNGPMSHLETSHEDICAPQDCFFRPNIDIGEESFSVRVKNESPSGDAQFLHEQRCGESGQHDDSSHLTDPVPAPNASVATPCLPEATSTDAFSVGRGKSESAKSDLGFIKKECNDDELRTDFADDIPLRERIKLLASTDITNLTCGEKTNNAGQTLPPPECGFSNNADDKEKRFSLKRKRKKTVTDSVETALEEDAPGLLQVLLDKGVTVEEIKLYGDVEDDAALATCSPDDSFEELENVISKVFSEGPSIFKFPSLLKVKGSKAVYCLACLISLIEQARYLRFRQSPVEWGWCRDLQSFIFVFERHNRLVLERPEYGYATYFFELVESVPIDWQIKRLVTAMKLPCCSRTILLENKPLLVGEDLTEGEAHVMEDYGWVRNSGLGTMLNYCDRVVHDKKNERYSLEWRAKIGKLLMKGHDGGRTVLSNLPKKVPCHIEDQNPEIKLEI